MQKSQQRININRHKIVFIFMMQDVFIKSVAHRFNGANRCSPKGLRYPPAVRRAGPEAKPTRLPRLRESNGGQMAGRHFLDANNYMLWVIIFQFAF